MKACVIIPARFNSSRFPGKPLVKLCGKEMILRVAEICSKAVGISNVFIATDDNRISNLVSERGFQAILTRPDLLTGTDRVAEASKNLDYEIYVNVQGDEPLIDPDDILKAIELKSNYPKSVINSYCSITKNENPNNLNIPKVVMKENHDLIYISRAKIPQSKNNDEDQIYNKQVCIYSYSKSDLDKFLRYGRKSSTEKIEDIEILRFFDLNINIKMFKASKSSLAVDVPEDVKKVENAIREYHIIQ